MTLNHAYFIVFSIVINLLIFLFLFIHIIWIKTKTISLLISICHKAIVLLLLTLLNSKSIEIEFFLEYFSTFLIKIYIFNYNINRYTFLLYLIHMFY